AVDCTLQWEYDDAPTAIGPSGWRRHKDHNTGSYALRCKGLGGEQTRVAQHARFARIESDDDATLLDYALLVNPDPLQASAQNAILMLVVSNSRREAVDCSSIVVTLPIGTGASSLTEDATGVQSDKPHGWTVTQNEAGVLTCKPKTPQAGTVGDKALVFTFSRIAVNDEPGTTAISIDETASTSTVASEVRSLDISTPKFPPQFHVSDLQASPLDVAAGGSTTLAWNGTAGAAYTYTLQYRPHDQGPPVSIGVGNTGPYVASNLTRANAVTFTLIVGVTVPGQDHPLIVQRQTSVTVETLTLEFDVEPPTVAPNGLVRLNWQTTNALSCTMDPGPAIGTSGPLYLVVPKTTVFTLTAKGRAGGSLQQQRTVTVDPTIVPNVPGRQIIGAYGGDGARGENGYGNAGRGGNAGAGGDAIVTGTLPPLDPSGRPARVMPITVQGGNGGRGGDGGEDMGADPGPIGPGGNGGNGGRGGDATLNVTLDASAGAPVQYVVIITAGTGGGGGHGGGGTSSGGDGGRGRDGIVTLLIDGAP
ncbi:MAG: hypothetical protein QOI11_944, partial [Candidatus Eremiobacteraeota bacterium]|nr:hypothetical protein [Candidatus Eremiobacteraeota bacterium]